MSFDDTERVKAIGCWLQGVVAAQRRDQQCHNTLKTSSSQGRPAKGRLMHHCVHMPTPPSSDPSMHQESMSPPKRRRTATDEEEDEANVLQPEADEGEDVERTPRRSENIPYRLSKPPSLPPSLGTSSSKTSTPSRPSAGSSRQRRSVSPIKRRQNLESLEKPVAYSTLMKPTEDLPPDIRPLYNRIHKIIVYRSEFMPGEVKDEIRSALDDDLPDSWFNNNTGRPASQALAELRALCEIETTARTSETLGRSELSWNLRVHSPLLELALAGHRLVESELVNTARIATPFIPPISDHNAGALAESKMVDFALVLTPAPSWFHAKSRLEGSKKDDKEDENLARAMKRIVLSQPTDAQSVNQTLYPPLKYRPIAVSIETKVNGSTEEGRVQLGIWASAWHRRIRSLMALARSEQESHLWADRSQDQKLIVTLPLILVAEHQWHLSFACDRGDHLQVVDSGVIGDTSTLLGLYTIVAVLQELAGWVEGPFREWIKDVFQQL